jgi:hypothetical protein
LASTACAAWLRIQAPSPANAASLPTVISARAVVAVNGQWPAQSIGATQPGGRGSADAAGAATSTRLGHEQVIFPSRHAGRRVPIASVPGSRKE